MAVAEKLARASSSDPVDAPVPENFQGSAAVAMVLDKVPEALRRKLALLTVLPGSFTAAQAASVGGLTGAELRMLHRMEMLDIVSADRYSMHSIVSMTIRWATGLCARLLAPGSPGSTRKRAMAQVPCPGCQREGLC